MPPDVRKCYALPFDCPIESGAEPQHCAKPKSILASCRKARGLPHIKRHSRRFLGAPFWNFEGETMNRKHTFAFLMLIASLVLCFYFLTGTQAQKPSPSPTPENPFAPETAPALPAGMTVSDTSDPRATLTPGMYDAGETALGLK